MVLGVKLDAVATMNMTEELLQAKTLEELQTLSGQMETDYGIKIKNVLYRKFFRFRKIEEDRLLTGR